MLLNSFAKCEIFKKMLSDYNTFLPSSKLSAIQRVETLSVLGRLVIVIGMLNIALCVQFVQYLNCSLIYVVAYVIICFIGINEDGCAFNAAILFYTEMTKLGSLFQGRSLYLHPGLTLIGWSLFCGLLYSVFSCITELQILCLMHMFCG